MIPNFKQFDTNIYRGGQPVLDEDWDYLRDLGITTIVKLNTEAEGTDIAAEALGIKIVYEPINLAEQIIFEPDKESIMRAVQAICPGTFVHCEHGQDRTGLVVGIYRVKEQLWDKEKAYSEMIENGFHPELLGLSLFWKWCV